MGPRLPLLDHLPVLAFWLFPSAIGAPVMARAVLRARRPAPGAPGPLRRGDPAERMSAALCGGQPAAARGLELTLAADDCP